jgi:hypothetical protein
VHYDVAAEWKRSERQGGIVVAQLEAGDTITNYASTKGPIAGPCVVAIELRRSGISTYIFDTSSGYPSWVLDAVKVGELSWVD